MKIKKLKELIRENKNPIDLLYGCYDWDDNILHMPTVIHLEHLVNGEWVPEDVSTSKFAEVRNDMENWRRRDDSFAEFRDYGPRGKDAFLKDTIDAINKGDFGPSWDAFIEYLSKGAIFAIITARGHSSEAIKKAVEWIIDNVLTDDQKQTLYSHCLKFAYLFGSDYDKYSRIPRGQFSQNPLIQDYLNSCDFYGVSSDEFIEKFGLGDASNPEKAKELALKAFNDKINEYGKKLGSQKVTLGFSDDDIRNVQHIEKIFKNELRLKYPIKYYLYDTSKKGLVGGQKKVISEGQTAWGAGAQTWGMDSSILPFTKWNSMNQNLYPNTKDEPNDDYHNQFKNQINQLGDLSKDVSKVTKLKKKRKRLKKL